jgi:hypothetical protein
VVLAGIDSAHCPMQQRLRLWDKLAGAWKPADLESIAREITLVQLGDVIGDILAGQVQGRVLVQPVRT